MAFTLLSQKLLKHKSLPLFCSFLLHYAKTVNFSFTLALSKVHPPLATSDQRDSSKDACVCLMSFVPSQIQRGWRSNWRWRASFSLIYVWVCERLGWIYGIQNIVFYWMAALILYLQKCLSLWATHVFLIFGLAWCQVTQNAKRETMVIQVQKHSTSTMEYTQTETKAENVIKEEYKT